MPPPIQNAGDMNYAYDAALGQWGKMMSTGGSYPLAGGTPEEQADNQYLTENNLEDFRFTQDESGITIVAVKEIGGAWRDVQPADSAPGTGESAPSPATASQVSDAQVPVAILDAVIKALDEIGRLPYLVDDLGRRTEQVDMAEVRRIAQMDIDASVQVTSAPDGGFIVSGGTYVPPAPAAATPEDFQTLTAETGQKFLMDRDGNLTRLTQEQQAPQQSIDDLIASELEQVADFDGPDEHLAKALQLRAFQNAPTPADRMQQLGQLLQLATSPADAFTLASAARGELPGDPRTAQLITQTVNAILGQFSPDTSTQTTSASQGDPSSVPSLTADALSGRPLPTEGPQPGERGGIADLFPSQGYGQFPGQGIQQGQQQQLMRAGQQAFAAEEGQGGIEGQPPTQDEVAGFLGRQLGGSARPKMNELSPELQSQIGPFLKNLGPTNLGLGQPGQGNQQQSLSSLGLAGLGPMFQEGMQRYFDQKPLLSEAFQGLLQGQAIGQPRGLDTINTGRGTPPTFRSAQARANMTDEEKAIFERQVQHTGAPLASYLKQEQKRTAPGATFGATRPGQRRITTAPGRINRRR